MSKNIISVSWDDIYRYVLRERFPDGRYNVKVKEIKGDVIEFEIKELGLEDEKK